MNATKSCENCIQAHVISHGHPGTYWESPEGPEVECTQYDNLPTEVQEAWDTDSYEEIASKCGGYEELRWPESGDM